MTQKSLAQIFGVTSDYISILERGAQTPGFMLAKRIADYFGVSVDEIFFENESNNTFDHGSKGNNSGEQKTESATLVFIKRTA